MFLLFYYHFVTESVNCFNFKICSCILQLFTKIFDLGINKIEVIYLIDMISPYRLCQCIFINQVSRAIYEV